MIPKARGVWNLAYGEPGGPGGVGGRGTLGTSRVPAALGSGFRLSEGGDFLLLEQGTDKRLLEP